jgi:hypothetical protein
VTDAFLKLAHVPRKQAGFYPKRRTSSRLFARSQSVMKGHQ